MNGRHRSVHFRLRALQALAVILSVAPLAMAAPTEVCPVALSGLPAPGSNGATYAQIYGGTAVVNDQDQVAFIAQLSGPGGGSTISDFGSAIRHRHSPSSPAAALSLRDYQPESPFRTKISNRRA